MRSYSRPCVNRDTSLSPSSRCAADNTPSSYVLAQPASLLIRCTTPMRSEKVRSSGRIRSRKQERTGLGEDAYRGDGSSFRAGEIQRYVPREPVGADCGEIEKQ